VLICDTNIWISYALFPESGLSQVIGRAIENLPYAMSNDTFSELADVLLRPKFDPYVSVETRQAVLQKIASAARWVSPTESIHDCRDSKDNKFLELVATCQAEFLITGDDDLLILNPFRKTRILTPAQFASTGGN